MPGKTVTLATAGTVYNVLTLLRAIAGYSQTKENAREIVLTGDPGNGPAKVFVGAGDVSSTSFGFQLIAAQGQTIRAQTSTSLTALFVTSDTNSAKLDVWWDPY